MAEKQSSVHRRLRNLRIVSQAVFFCWFLGLLLKTHFSGQDYIGPVEQFFHFDPFLALVVSIAGRTFSAVFLWSLILVAGSIVFGRYLCGWVCPFGAVLQFFSFVFKKMKLNVPVLAGNRWLHSKYVILGVIIVAAVFSLDLAGYADPLVLLGRSVVAVVFPAFALAGNSAGSILHKLGMAPAGDSLRELISSLTLSPFFHQAWIIGFLFLCIVFLNLYSERFWCRYLCPAGALLALLSRRNLVKVSVDAAACTQCKACTRHCQTQANPFPNEKWQAGECIYCYSCASLCPSAAISFPMTGSTAGNPFIDMPRRKWLLSTLMGLSIIPLFKIPSSGRPSSKLIRPPGSLPESKFLSVCAKCGVCMKACPTNALQPASTQAGAEGLWTPVLVFTDGYCEYYCSLCSQVCPTGAIRELKIKNKVKVKIGSAWINKSRCIPYAQGKPCTVCEEKCPTSPKAIRMLEMEMPSPDGKIEYLGVPEVDLDQCIGCGICETKCPMSDEPAIYCTNYGETRSRQEMS